MAEYLPILGICILAAIAHNNSVAIAAGALFVLKLVGANSVLVLTQKYALTIGIIILTMAVLAPIATGEITFSDLKQASFSLVGIGTMLIGIFVAWIAGKGIVLMQVNPQTLAPLIIGTLLGVCFFKGVPVGPLIAAGFVYFLLQALGIK